MSVNYSAGLFYGVPIPHEKAMELLENDNRSEFFLFPCDLYSDSSDFILGYKIATACDGNFTRCFDLDNAVSVEMEKVLINRIIEYGIEDYPSPHFILACVID